MNPTLRYVLVRLLQAVVVVILVTIVVFALLHAVPGGPARAILGVKASHAQIVEFDKQQGLDQPVIVQYFLYLRSLFEGDLGTSYTLNESVGQLIVDRLPKTLLLTAISLIIALIIAVPLGMWQAVRRNRVGDYAATTVGLVVYATPVFLLGLVLIAAFSQALPWFPSQAPAGTSIGQVFAQPAGLVLPVVTGAAALLAVFSRYMRSATLDNLAEDYVRTARSGGASELAVLGKHVLRNSLTPLAALLGYYLPTVFAGALVIEQLFNYPGMGLLFWNAAQSSDYPVLLGCVLVISVATVVGSLLADLAQMAIDPRVKAARS